MSTDLDLETTAFTEESVTVADSAATLTAATYAPSNAPAARAAVLQLETAQIRYWRSGATPTALLGHLMNVGDIIRLIGPAEIANFKAIRTGGTSGTLRVTYER